MSSGKKYFIITIDTEGDNLWAVTDIKKNITTENANYLFRFQELSENYKFIPTYLVNYEMALDDAMTELGRAGIRRGVLEIGAHEHAWNQPPIKRLIKRPGKFGKPYLHEYSMKIIRDKLHYLTSTLEERFQCDITSHRGGRWCLNEIIVDELQRLGYIVDCTCTPGINWNNDRGWTWGAGGTDWSKYSNDPFYLRGKLSDSTVLEVPVSVIDQRENGHLSWLRPDLNNKKELISLLHYIKNSNLEYAEFMIHSSELMPRGSPIFTNKGKIEYLYRCLEEVFECANDLGFVGIGLTEYALHYKKDRIDCIRGN